MKNKLCMLLLASGIGLFSCAEKDLPGSPKGVYR